MVAKGRLAMGNELIKSGFGLSDRKTQYCIDPHGSARRTGDSQDSGRLKIEIAVRIELQVNDEELAPYAGSMTIRIQID